MSGGKEDKSVPHRERASLGSLRQAHVLRSNEEAGRSTVIRVVGRERSEAPRSRENCVRPCKYSH